jgi:IstB-like ATP binding protein
MSTRRGVTEQAAIAAIDSGTRVLRLPTIRDLFEEIAAAAEREQLSYLGFLAELVMAECDDRDKRRAARRIHDAGFPRDKRVEEFDFAANPNVSAAVIHRLATCAWVKAGHPLCLIGDSGTGKSHLLIGLGTAAAEAGHRVRYTLASKLVNELVEAADDKQLSKTISRYGRRSSLPERARLHGTRPSRRRVAVPGLDGAGGTISDRHRLQRAVLRLDQDLHRPATLRRHRRPAHLRRPDHRNRHHQLPARTRASSAADTYHFRQITE